MAENYALMDDDDVNERISNVTIEKNVVDIEHLHRKKRRQCILLIVIFSILIIIALICGFFFGIFVEKKILNDQDFPEICPNNNTAYPMKGGAGCKKACNDGYYSASLNFEAPWESEFLDRVNISTKQIVKDFHKFKLDNDSVVFLDIYDNVHMTMDYFCCLDEEELELLDELVANWTWTPTNVTFTEVKCTQDGWHELIPYEYNQIVEIIIYCDERSQNLLSIQVAKLEEYLESMGVPVHVPRVDNIGFHVTIGFVNGSAGYPVNTVIEQLNNIIPWSDDPMLIGDLNNNTICSPGKPIGGVNYTCLTA